MNARGLKSGVTRTRPRSAVKRKTLAKRRTSAPDPEATLYKRIRELVISARRTIARGVDLVQVHTNFEIGRHIVEYEQRRARHERPTARPF